MVIFNRTYFGAVVIDGASYGDVLVVDDKVELRDKEKVEAEVKSTHLVAPSEVDIMLASDPDIIIIGTGQRGVLEVSPKIDKEIKKAQVELMILPTPKAIYKYNELKKQGKKVNALIHVTC